MKCSPARHHHLTVLALLLAAFALVLRGSVARAQQVVLVAVSPGVVPVGLVPSAKASLLVAATVRDVSPGTSTRCTVSVRLEPSGTLLFTSPAVATSPAAASGVTSLSVLATIAGATPAGAAQASVTCDGSSGTAPFRIASVVALNVTPFHVPAGGVATLVVAIASNGALPFPAQCTLTLTAPPGAGPPIALQTVAVKGGSTSTPATSGLAVTLPATAPSGPANASVSCVIQGVGTYGDSQDFTITDASVVSVLGFTNPVAAGSSLSVTAVSIPGFTCAGQLALVDGVVLRSASVGVDASGTAALTIAVPAAARPGPGSLSVTCSDPSNPTNSAVSAPQTVVVAGVGGTSINGTALPLSVSLLNTATSLPAGSPVSVAVSTTPNVACAVSAFTDASGVQTSITEPAASGVAAANGSLALTFHIPANAADGRAVLTVTCTGASAQASAPLTLVVLSAGGASNCSDAGVGQPSGATPVASAGSSYSGSAGEPLRFRGAGSAASVGAVLTSCHWSFGDGQTATTLDPAHTYAAAGDYTVSLTVTDSAGLSATATTTATIGSFVPLCSQPQLTGNAGLTACVTGLTCPATSLPATCLPPCLTLTLNPLLCPQPTITVQLGTGGPYRGQPLQPLPFQAGVTINGTRRVCAADASLGTAGPVCHLVAAVNLPAPVQYRWDFGDGSTGDDASVVHAYAAAGRYTVSLSVGFDNGATASATTVAQIAPLPSANPLASLTPGCTQINENLTTSLTPGALAARVSGAGVSAIWAAQPGQPARGWFPNASAPVDLTQINPGDSVWICAG